MSRFYDAVIEAERVRSDPGRVEQPKTPPPERRERPFQVLTVASNKGGVGKTTLASNLAVYLRALCEDLPILVLGLDDQLMLDRMFALNEGVHEKTVATGLRAQSFAGTIQLGEYGIHYVPSDPEVAELKRQIDDPLQLERALDRTGWRGLVIVDTKSDLEILTRNAIAASDLTLLPVRDKASLVEAEKVFELLDRWDWAPTRARIVLSMIDLRIKYRAGEARDILALLVSQIRDRGHPLFESFVSSSPKIEALATNPEGHTQSVLHGAPRSIVHRQLHHLAEEVLKALDRKSPRLGLGPSSSRRLAADHAATPRVPR